MPAALPRTPPGRRSVLRRLSGAALGGALASWPLPRRASGESPIAADWPQFRGNPLLTGLAKAGLPTPLRVAWSHEAGESIDSSAAILGGVVYVGTQSGEVLALDLATGARQWAYAAGAPIGESSPAAVEGLVYVGDLKGVIHAILTRDGKAVWTYNTKTEIKASPVVAAGRVLVGSYDSNLYALDAKSGSLAWAFETSGQVHATSAVQAGLAYVTGCDALLRAIRVADGKEVFQVASGAYTGASPALQERRAYYGTFENEVLCVDLDARKVLWRYRHPQREFPFYSSAALAEGKVVLGGRDRMVHAIDAATGKAAWTFTTRGRVDSSPAVAARKVYVGSADGRLYVLDLATGRSLQEFDAGAPISASPAIAAGRLVVGTQDGRIYCFAG